MRIAGAAGVLIASRNAYACSTVRRNVAADVQEAGSGYDSISNINSEADVRGAGAARRCNLHTPAAIESATHGKSAGGWKRRYIQNCRDGKGGATNEHQSILR